MKYESCSVAMTNCFNQQRAKRLLNSIQIWHAEWSTQDVVDKFLQPINMEHMAKDFLANNINGAALIALEVSHNINVSVHLWYYSCNQHPSL